jgi:hypothetical protein
MPRLPPSNFLEEFIRQLEGEKDDDDAPEVVAPPRPVSPIAPPAPPPQSEVPKPNLDLEMLAALLKLVCMANTTSSTAKINEAAILAVKNMANGV